MQWVVGDDEYSWFSSVTSEVSQNAILGPLIFLIYVNDIADNASSTLQLFADYCLLYRVIKSEVDTSRLQCDLDHLLQWF